jgi:hypothetical protein
MISIFSFFLCKNACQKDRIALEMDGLRSARRTPLPMFYYLFRILGKEYPEPEEIASGIRKKNWIFGWRPDWR